MARGISRLDFGAGSFANPYAGLQEAIGDISKSYLQREALDREEKRLVAAQEREDKRWDAQQARLDVADRRALDQYNERLNREDARNVILDQRYSTEAAQKQKLFDKQIAEYEKKTREEAALNNALANPVGARSALDIAKADVETSLGGVMPEIEKHLAQMSPEERKVAKEGAIAPLARDVLKTLTKEDYEAQEYDRLFNRYKEMGTPAANIPTLVERDLKIGQVKSPDLMSRADVAASLKAETEKAKELLKSELDVAKLGDGNKLSVGEDGQLTVNTGKGTFTVGGKPMSVDTAASKFQDKMKGSSWWLGTDPNNRDFDRLMDTAVKGITSTVTDQKQKDALRVEAYKSLTPEVLSQFVAAKDKNATTLSGLLTEQARLTRQGLGTEPGKELSGLIAAKNKYQELLQRGARPTYTGSLSRLADASELDTLVGNTEELNNKVVPRAVLTQPSTENETSSSARTTTLDPVTELAQKRLAQEQQAREVEQRFQEMRQAKQDIASVGGSEAVIKQVPEIAVTVEALQDKGVAPDRAKALAVLAYRTGNSNPINDILDAPEPTLFGGSRGTGLTPQEAVNRSNILKAFWETVKPESKADFLRKLEPAPKNNKPLFEYSKDLLSPEDLLKMKAAQEQEEAVQQKMKELQGR
jgi:hypothetical protein